MLQRADGVGIQQVSVEASENVNITVNGQLALQLLTPAYPKSLSGENRREIDLLKAPHAQVPFMGRQAIFQDFVDWCSLAHPVSMRTLVGQGGAGKTRFAYELYAYLNKQPNWAAYFLRFLKNEAKEVDLWNHLKNKNALIIADYASDSAKPLADLLTPLTDSAPPGRRIRVLLLARTANWEQGWLAGLAGGRTGEAVDKLFHPREPISLPDFSTEDRQAIFQETVKLAAKFTGKPLPRLPSSEEFAKKEFANRQSDPLTLGMAALIALRSGASSALSLSPAELAHEVSQELVATRMNGTVEDHKELFLHMAAYATLCGGLDEDQALRALEQESAHTHLGQVADPIVFLHKLQAWLPGEKNKTWIGAIEPDIVGEAYVLGRGKRLHLRDSDAAVLRAASHRSGPTIETIVRIAQDFSSGMKPRLEPLAWLSQLLERGEADEDLTKLCELSDAMPGATLALRNMGLRISTALRSRLRILSERPGVEAILKIQPLFARSLNVMANRQSDVGQREAALATAQESANLYCQLATADREAFLHHFADSLNTLAVMQSFVGQREAALATAQEAVGLSRELVEWNRDAFLRYLAMSLNTLSNRQSDVGQREAALATALETVEFDREEVVRNRDAFLPNLAKSLTNLASKQSDVGQHEAALATAQEAASFYRELVGRNRDAFLPGLATSLHNLANKQRDAGQREAALANAQETVDLRRELVSINYNAFAPKLALSLITLAAAQSDVEQQDEAALAAAQEAAELYRELVSVNRSAFLPGLATSLITLGACKRAVGQHEAALATSREAAELYRELV